MLNLVIPHVNCVCGDEGGGGRGFVCLMSISQLHFSPGVGDRVSNKHCSFGNFLFSLKNNKSNDNDNNNKNI